MIRHTHYNGKPLNEVESLCRGLCLAVGTWSPGDSHGTRFRFFKADGTGMPWANYDIGHEIATVLGRKAAIEWLHAYRDGRAAGVREAIAEVARGYNADMSGEQLAQRLDMLLSAGPWLNGPEAGDAEAFRAVS